MSSPVSSERFAVVDVETSGLSAERNHVLQVGVVVVDGDGVVLDRYSSLIAPRSRWFFRVGPTKIHGIHRRDARRAPSGASCALRTNASMSSPSCPRVRTAHSRADPEEEIIAEIL